MHRIQRVHTIPYHTTHTRAPPLNGRDDKDGDTGTDTTAPDDDNDDIASLASQQTAAIPYLKSETVPHTPLWEPPTPRMDQHARELEDLFDDHQLSQSRVSGVQATCFSSSVTYTQAATPGFHVLSW